MDENKKLKWGELPRWTRMEIGSANFARNAGAWNKLSPSMQHQLFKAYGGDKDPPPSWKNREIIKRKKTGGVVGVGKALRGFGKGYQ